MTFSFLRKSILRRLRDNIFVLMNLSFSICLLVYRIDFTILILYGELFEKCMLLFASEFVLVSSTWKREDYSQLTDIFFFLVVAFGLSR